MAEAASESTPGQKSPGPSTPKEGASKASGIKGWSIDLKELGKELQDCKKPDQVLVSQLREQVILEEMEVIKKESHTRFSGIYVMPSFSSVWDWHGVICIRAGLYQHGVFKFLVKIAPRYPVEPPRISFIPQCIPFHPFVDPRNGVVNFQYVLMQDSNPTGTWDPKRHRMHTLLFLLKSIFYPNPKDARIKDTLGDPAVKPFQLFNPSFQSSGAGAAVLKGAVLNFEAAQILTKNYSWWQQHGERLKELEGKLGMNVNRISQEALNKARELDSMLAQEFQLLAEELHSPEINYKSRVIQCVEESQDRLKYNHGDFSLRIRNDVEEFYEDKENRADDGGLTDSAGSSFLSIKELLSVAGVSVEEEEPET